MLVLKLVIVGAAVLWILIALGALIYDGISQNVRSLRGE